MIPTESKDADLAPMIESARREMLHAFKREYAIVERLANSGPVPFRIIESFAEFGQTLANGSTSACLALVRRRGQRGYSVTVWLPGLEGFDLFGYTFSGAGERESAGSMLHSSMLVGH